MVSHWVLNLSLALSLAPGKVEREGQYYKEGANWKKKKKGIGLAGGKDTLAEARKGIPGGDIWAPACRGWSWGGGRNPGWCGTCSLLCLCQERHSQLSNDSWARAADGITALGEKLITNMNQPCLFLLAGLWALQGVGRAPRWMYRKSYLGGNMKPAISHRRHAVTCVWRLQGNLLHYRGRESPQGGRQEDEPFLGPSGFLGSTRAVTPGQVFISASPTPTPALKLPLDWAALGLETIFWLRVLFFCLPPLEGHLR